MTDEEKEEKLKQAQEWIKKIKDEYDAELKKKLDTRKRAGVGNDGDAVTDEDIKEWESEQ